MEDTVHLFGIAINCTERCKFVTKNEDLFFPFKMSRLIRTQLLNTPKKQNELSINN